ncbi:MAG: peptidase S41 [Bacteroides sp.]|nr:peptidase S41 [Bacteroides sp.]
MKRINYLTLFWLVMAIMMVSCNDDKEIGIAEQSWTEGEVFEISTQQDVTVRFTAYSKWVASVGNGGDWCKLSQTAGDKGSHSFIVSVTGETTTERTATINIQTEDSPASSFQVIQRAGEYAEDATINREVDKYLNNMYLWNDEYKSLTKNFNQGYEEFFYGNLMNMNTNTLDKKPTGNGRYNLFSYIQKLPNLNNTRAIEKELEYSFGITGITPVSIGTQTNYTIYFCIQGVHPDSPASEAGLKRGAMISLVNGKKITDSNINEYYYNMQVPDAAISYTLTEDVIEEGMITSQKEYSLTAKAMYVNPVIFNQISEEYEGHRIGYLVYSGFEAGFDKELFDVFKEFKEKKVTDLILDLRYNGGGHVISANLIASCIAGSSCSDKVFAQYRYNTERMKAYGNSRPEEKFSYSRYNNLGTSLAAGDLSLKHLYCLVGNGTASASELVINSLRGIGIEVTLIGETTTGKNVGMEVMEIEINKDTYHVAPITFQSYNAQGFGDYENGFTPDVAMKETNPYNEQGIFYILKEYGTSKEPLYAKAIELITGTNPMTTTRSAMNTLNGNARKMPVLFRPGHSGMLKPAANYEQ